MTLSQQFTEADYMFLPVAEVAAPSRGTFFQCYRNVWWKVHPDKGLVFFNPVVRQGPRAGRRRHSWLGFPQCNTDERIVRSTVVAPCPFPTEVRQFLVVFVPIEISDYSHD